jgi:hypothetical protein
MFVITAALAQLVAPTDSHIIELINIHVVAKVSRALCPKLS